MYVVVCFIYILYVWVVFFYYYTPEERRGNIIFYYYISVKAFFKNKIRISNIEIKTPVRLLDKHVAPQKTDT